MNINEDDAIRFWSKVNCDVNDDDCWVWIASINDDGYGQFKLKGKVVKAHRVAWMLSNGEIPPNDGSHDSLCVLHTCDNPPCCNPNHLFLGTHSYNMKDMSNKSRAPKGGAPRGINNGMAKFSNEDIERMKNLLLEGHTQKAVADLTGSSQAHVSRVVRGVSR